MDAGVLRLCVLHAARPALLYLVISGLLRAVSCYTASHSAIRS
jgi:hypothetical protein